MSSACLLSVEIFNDDEIHLAEVAKVQALAAAVRDSTHLGQEFSGNCELRLINLEGLIP